MKHLYTLLLLLTANFVFSQFVHMKPNEEAPEQVELVMNDATSRIGKVKNNKADYMVLRILSQDASSFRHANVEVEYIQFKPEGKTEYEKIPVKDIKHITFKGDEDLRFDRINVYRFKKKTLEIKNDEPAMMIQTPKVDEYIVMYSNLYLNRGSSVYDQYNLFVRLKNSDKTYYVQFLAGVKDKHNLPQLKILAPNNKDFSDFIDQLADKNTAVFKEYYDMEKELTDEVTAYLKANRKSQKLSSEDERGIYMNAKYRFMFSYISKKLEAFSS